MTAPVWIAGHSLGAARALLYAYARVVRGLRVDGVYALAPPQPGSGAIGLMLARVPVVRAFRNRRDPVPLVPAHVGWLGEDYAQPHELEALNEAPAGGGLFADHHVGLYVDGINKLATDGGARDAAAEVARLYVDRDGWDWAHLVDGQYWAMRVMPCGARLMIARGSKTALDWLDDFEAVQVSQFGARVSAGFWAGVGPVLGALDGALGA